MDLLFALARVGLLTKHRGGVKLRNKLAHPLFFNQSLRLIVKKLGFIGLRLHLWAFLKCGLQETEANKMIIVQQYVLNDIRTL